MEIWSRFMRSAHQGVAVAALPGLTGALHRLGAPGVARAGASGAGRLAVGPAPIERGLDGWFIDRLFGRR